MRQGYRYNCLAIGGYFDRCTKRLRFRVRFENGNVSVFNQFMLVSPTEKERKYAFVRVQIEYSLDCVQVRFGPVVRLVWIGSEYGFVVLLDESASESHMQVLGQRPKITGLIKEQEPVSDAFFNYQYHTPVSSV